LVVARVVAQVVHPPAEDQAVGAAFLALAPLALLDKATLAAMGLEASLAVAAVAAAHPKLVSLRQHLPAQMAATAPAL
jgi:hypothetical protein